MLTSFPDDCIGGPSGPGSPAFLAESRFRFGSLLAVLKTDDLAFKTRFLRIFSDCLEPANSHSGPPSASLEVVASYPGSDQVFAEILPHHGCADVAALSIIFPELRKIPAAPHATDDWQLFARGLDARRAVVAVRGSRMVFDRETPWQITIAHYFLSHVMRLQPQMFFFHGATVAIGDKGVLLSGSKGAGKSTLSLALAARGHGFLGDEVATIERNSGSILPFPRAVSIRHGPQAHAVLAYLAKHQVDKETLPDGTSRMRTAVSKMFPAAKARQVPLTHAFFLSALAQTPSTTPIAFSLAHLPLLAPLHATLTSIAPGERTLGFLRLFSRARCYMLTPGGTPDQTAELIDTIVEGTWDTASKRKPNVLAPFAG